MQSRCPYARTSFSVWRWRVLQRLTAGIEHTNSPRLTFLYPRLKLDDRRNFHASTARTRGSMKDVKRSAKHRAVELELEKYTKEGIKPEKTSGFKEQSRRNNNEEWVPYDTQGMQELQDLVTDLRSISKDEDTLFEHGSRIYKRKNPHQPESPLERKSLTHREKKLQVHEVERDRRLENNVWAQILASPVRLDRSTWARLPKSLMTTWGVMKNPKDGQDYLMPVELSDIEALKRELDRDLKKLSTSGDAQELPIINPDKPPPGTRTNIVPNKLLLQSITDELMHLKPHAKLKEKQLMTNVTKLNVSLIPPRWRAKQGEMQAFYKTREKFNKALNREPDEDEIDMEKMAKLDNLQWQADIVDRVEKIMKERVLIALEAVGKDNSSGRAIHDRRILALALPENGNFNLDEKGRIGADQTSGVVQATEVNLEQETSPKEMPEWIHGSICLHIGKPETLTKSFQEWHEFAQMQPNQNMPSRYLTPSMVTIDTQFRVPIFNLETLVGETHLPRLQDLIKANKTFNLSFWQDYSKNPNESKSNSDSQPETGFKTSESNLTIPEAALEAGEQVLSSIVTPRLSTALPDADIISLSDSSESKDQDNTNSHQADSYVLLVKAQAQHASILAREIWQLWRYIGGREALDLGENRSEGVSVDEVDG